MSIRAIKNPAPSQAPGQQEMSDQDEPSLSGPDLRPASKKIFRWQVAMRAWARMELTYTHEDQWTQALLNYIYARLAPGQFSVDSLLFYFRHDTDEAHQVKKNSKNIFFNKHLGRSVLTKSATFEKMQSQLIASLSLQARSQQIHKPFEGRLWLMAHFYFPKSRYFTKAGEVSETLPDLSNLLELPQDCMQESKVCQSGNKKGRILRKGAGIISNDSHIDSLDGSRRMPWDRDHYRMEIFLMRYAGHDARNTTSS